MMFSKPILGESAVPLIKRCAGRLNGGGHLANKTSSTSAKTLTPFLCEWAPMQYYIWGGALVTVATVRLVDICLASA